MPLHDSAIRFGGRHDVRELVRMHQRCSRLSISRRYLSPMPELSIGLAGRLLCPPAGFSLVIEHGGCLAGITTVAPYAERDSWTPDLDVRRRADIGQLVADSVQRQGIGTALLIAAAREAGRRGFDELVMSVHPDNPAVIALVHATGLRARVGTHAGLTEVRIGLGGLRRSGVHADEAKQGRPGEGRLALG